MTTGLKTSGGEGGIRTLGTGFSPYNGLANRRIRPLCHLSGGMGTVYHLLLRKNCWTPKDPKMRGKVRKRRPAPSNRKDVSSASLKRCPPDLSECQLANRLPSPCRHAPR